MTLLKNLIATRAAFEKFLGKSADLSASGLTRLSDRELELTGNVIIVRNRDRVFQISIQDDSVPTAFIKRVGVNYEKSLLQVIVSSSNLRLVASDELFRKWMVSWSPEEKVRKLADKF